VLDEFDSGALIDGAVVDESTDPPFTIGSQLSGGRPNPAVFGGPALAASLLLNEIEVSLDGESWGTIKQRYRPERE
jgi:hypothetical protein